MSFLLGSGCSLEAVPTTDELKKQLKEQIKNINGKTLEEIKNIDDKTLEEILEILYSQKFYSENSQNSQVENPKSIIETIKETIFNKCQNPKWKNNEKEKYNKTLENYKTFYKN